MVTCSNIKLNWCPLNATCEFHIRLTCPVENKQTKKSGLCPLNMDIKNDSDSTFSILVTAQTHIMVIWTLNFKGTLGRLRLCPSNVCKTCSRNKCKTSPFLNALTRHLFKNLSKHVRVTKNTQWIFKYNRIILPYHRVRICIEYPNHLPTGWLLVKSEWHNYKHFIKCKLCF